MVIMGIDPGYAIVGYGVIEARAGRFLPLEHGAVTTEAGENFSRRLEIIYEDVTTVLQKWRPGALSLEKLYFTNNKTTAIGVARGQGGDPPGGPAEPGAGV